ncbi:helix-turn-helix domain-containing protein [Alcaligenes faecalis]|uniref:helix-turn-helix domain-containing protein n=2 Tax=Alcaligenes TaxID=507 RepID=UPI00359CAB2A
MDMYILSTSDQLGYQLVARRKALGLTQQEVASRLGISQNRLSELESQPSQLTVERLLALTGILGLELAIQQRSQAPLSTSEW